MQTKPVRYKFALGSLIVHGGLTSVIAGVSLQAFAANVNILPDATFNEFIAGSLGPTYGLSLATPETIFDDLQQSDATVSLDAQAQVITTGGNRPAVDVIASSQVTNLIEDGTRAGMQVSAGGDIRYAISIQPRAGVTLPGSFYDVPISVQALGSVLWQGSNLDEDFVSGTALARVTYRGQSVEAYYGYGGCTGSGGCIVGPGGGFDYTFTDTIRWNSSTSSAPVRDIVLTATVGFRPFTYIPTPRQTIPSNSVSVQAIADPMLSFVNSGDEELFEFIVSPGLMAVPIPPALWLFGSGFLGLVGVASRKRAT